MRIKVWRSFGSLNGWGPCPKAREDSLLELLVDLLELPLGLLVACVGLGLELRSLFLELLFLLRLVLLAHCHVYRFRAPRGR